MRSSPHVRFARAMALISWRNSAGTGGRPRGFDLQRQNSRNPVRCHRSSVSGCTIVSNRRQSTRRDNATSAIRVASSARQGFACRSRYSANCFLRKRFSAARAARGRHSAATNRATSLITRRRVGTLRR